MTAPGTFQLCESIDALPENAGGRIWQRKLDGVRALVSADRIWLRTTDYPNKSQYGRPHVAIPGAAVLDGEVVSQRNGGGADDDHGPFYLVTPAIQRGEWGHGEQKRIRFVPFDVLYDRNGRDVRGLPLIERMLLLQGLVPGAALDVFAAPYTGMPEVPATWEGLVGKNPASAYTGRRSKDWVKWKRVDMLDAVFVGVEEGEGAKAGTTGAVIFAYAKNGRWYKGTAAGITNAQADYLWDKWADHVGRPIIIRHYGVNAGSLSLRNPLFHGFRERDTTL